MLVSARLEPSSFYAASAIAAAMRILARSIVASSGWAGGSTAPIPAMPAASMKCPAAHSSFMSAHTAPTSLTSEASEGNTWTALVLRFISLFARSWTLFVLRRSLCSAGNPR